MSMDPRKSNKIREIFKLQQILKNWRRLANSSKTSSSSGSKSIKFLKRTLSLSKREGGSSNAVLKGYLAVCIGEELKRFSIPAEYLGHQAFHKLLREAEEEFGFQRTGVLRIPREVSVFESILKMVESKKDKFSTQKRRLSFEEMVGCCPPENQLAYSHHSQSPMCR